MLLIQGLQDFLKNFTLIIDTRLDSFDLMN